MIKVGIDGVSLTSLGLGVKKHDIPPLPETKEYSLEIAGQDGSLDFGMVYGPRLFNLECVLMANDTTIDYQTKIAAIAAVLDARKGERYFTFSDRPGIRYPGRYAGTLSIEKIIFDGNFTIPIKMSNPFPESLIDTSSIEYGQGLEYEQRYEYSTHSIQITSSSETFQISNDGTMEVAPFIRIAGNFTNLSLSDGFNNLNITDVATVSDVYEIDCNPKKCTVKKNGLNAYAKSNGVFFLLRPGITNFVANSTSPNFKIEFIFRYKYLY